MLETRTVPRQRSRWRLATTLLVAIALTLGMRAAASAQGIPTVVWFSIEVLPKQDQFVLCAGQKTEILVRVKRVVLGPGAGPGFASDVQVSGVKVTATLSNPRIAKVTRKGLVTGEQQLLLSDPYEENGLRFDVTAAKPGTGTLEFKTTIGRYWIGEGAIESTGKKPFNAAARVNLKVVPCDYEFSDAHSASTGIGVIVTATSHLRVVADDEGGLKGTGDVAWVGTNKTFPDCTSTTTVRPSKVDVTGQIDDDGQLALHIVYGTTRYSQVVPYCANPHHLTGYARFPLTLPPIDAVLDAEGGSIELTRAIPALRIFKASDHAIAFVEPVEPVEQVGVARVAGNASVASGVSVAAEPSSSPEPTSTAEPTPSLEPTPSAETPSSEPAASLPPIASPSPVPATIAFGDGPFDLPDPAAGLGDLSSYVGTLTVTFDGTSSGAPVSATSSAVMQVSGNDRALTIEPGAGAAAIVRADANDTAYSKTGDAACIAQPLVDGQGLADLYEPAAQLLPLFGAEDAGTEVVNGVASHHYTFDEHALGIASFATATGDVWIAEPGGYVVSYRLGVQAGSEYLGESTSGTRTIDYELTDPNVPAALNVPADCPQPVDAPLLPDATGVVSLPGMVSFTSGMSLKAATAFYARQLKSLGWTPTGSPGTSKSSAYLTFKRDGTALTVTIHATPGSTDVRMFTLR
jgi:hypothetical protein